jgi:predicted nucleotidyltransferase
MVDSRTVGARLTSQLKKTIGSELKSVVLYGSVPRGEAVPGVSDLNALVLLDSLAPTRLAKITPLLQDWVRGGNTPPSFYTVDEWLGMADTFAIEIADMLDAREVLWGLDPVTPDTVTLGDLRLHTEREIRETILHLRLRLVLAANVRGEVGSLLLAGLPSFTAYMRAALRLTGQQAPRETGIAIERAAALIGGDPKPMLECWQLRGTHRPLDVSVTDPMVEQYIEFVQQLLQYLDRPPAPGTDDANASIPAAPAARAHY